MSGKAIIDAIFNAIGTGIVVLDRDTVELQSMNVSSTNALSFAVASYKKAAMMTANMLSEISAVYKIEVPRNIIITEDSMIQEISILDIQNNIDTRYNNRNPNCIGKLIIIPIDSLQNFMHTIPLISYSVVMFDENESIIAAAMHDISANLKYSTMQGLGVYSGNTRVRLKKSLKISQSVIVIHNIENAIKFYGLNDKKVVAKLYNMRNVVGSVLSLNNTNVAMAYLATGKIHAVIDMAVISQTDILSGLALALEMGIKISDINGQSFSSESKTLIAAHPSIYDEIMEILS